MVKITLKTLEDKSTHEPIKVYLKHSFSLLFFVILFSLSRKGDFLAILDLISPLYTSFCYFFFNKVAIPQRSIDMGFHLVFFVISSCSSRCYKTEVMNIIVIIIISNIHLQLSNV